MDTDNSVTTSPSQGAEGSTPSESIWHVALPEKARTDKNECQFYDLLNNVLQAFKSEKREGFEIIPDSQDLGLPDVRVKMVGTQKSERVQLDRTYEGGSTWHTGTVSGIQLKIWGYNGRHSNSFIRRITFKNPEVKAKVKEMVDDAISRMNRDIRAQDLEQKNKDFISSTLGQLDYKIRVENYYPTCQSATLSLTGLTAEEVQKLVALYRDLDTSKMVKPSEVA